MQAILSILHTDPSHLIASLLVGFYAWNRFSTPRTVRSQTSRFQYYGSCLTYVASCEGLMWFVAWVVQQNPALLDVFHMGSKGEMGKSVDGLEAPLVAALMLTTLLPTFPVLRDVDAKMLGVFHGIGRIPFNAIRWAQRIGSCTFHMTDSSFASAKKYVKYAPELKDELAKEMVNDPGADSIRYGFTEVAVLYVAYRNLDSQPRFANAFPEIAKEFEEKIASCFAQCLGYFVTDEQLSPQRLQPAVSATANIRSVILASAADVRLMLARVLLYSCNNEAAVAEKLRKLGFSIPTAKRIRLPYNLLCFDLIGVVLLFGVSTALSPAAHMHIEKAFAIGLLVATNHVLAAVFALLPKQVWGFADIRQAKERPTLAYLVSAFAAFTVGLSLSYGFFLLRTSYLPSSGPILPFHAQCKWLLLSTVLAFALAFECDDYLHKDFAAPRWIRWAEGAGLALIMAGTGAFVVHWLAPDQAQLHPNGHAPHLWFPIGLSATIGALFGATIPHWYRTSVRQVAEQLKATQMPAHIPVESPIQPVAEIIIKPEAAATVRSEVEPSADGQGEQVRTNNQRAKTSELFAGSTSEAE